jgi:hypothetical protein
MRKLIGAIVAVTLLGIVFVTSFVGALHQPEPHGVPIAVVGPAQVVGQLRQAITQKAPGAFDLRGYESEPAARDALLSRDVDGVLVAESGRLLVASAAGRVASTVITEVFRGAAQAQGRQFAVEDVVPLPPGDSGGASGMFYLLALLIPGLAIAVLIAQMGVGVGARLGGLVVAALAVGLANAWLADVVFGALPGRFSGLAGLSAGIVLSIGLVVTGVMRVVGLAGVGLVALLFFPIGLPASGGPVGARFVPEWYAAVGQVLPLGPAGQALRNVVFFDGAAIAGPLAILGGWALLGLLLMAMPVRRRTERAPAAPAHTVGVS